jgi:hypothetical protein
MEEGKEFSKNLGRNTPRDREAVATVIACDKRARQ